MTTAAEHVLRCFDDLTESERHEVAAEILRRTLARDFLLLEDEALTEIASLTFRELDEREAAKNRSREGEAPAEPAPGGRAR